MYAVFFIIGKDPMTKSSSYKFKWLIFLLIFTNEFEKASLQVSAFSNELWKGNLLGIDFRQIDQNSQNLGKLIPQRFALNKIDIFKVIS